MVAGRRMGAMVAASCALLACACAGAAWVALLGMTPHEGERHAEPAEAPVVVERAADGSRLSGMFSRGEIGSVRLIGDSITAGFLCDGYDSLPPGPELAYSGPQGSYLETSPQLGCWANDFRDWAGQRGAVRFVNAAVSGFRMQFLAEAPESWLGEGADVIVVMLGTNDAAKEPADAFEAYARDGLAAAAARCKHLVVVSPPNNRRTDATNLYGMDEVDRVLSGVCDEAGYEHVSLYDALDLGGPDLCEDQVHPTTAGSHKLWRAFCERLGLV